MAELYLCLVLLLCLHLISCSVVQILEDEDTSEFTIPHSRPFSKVYYSEKRSRPVFAVS